MSPSSRPATFRDLPKLTPIVVHAFSEHPLRRHMLPGKRRRAVAIATGDMALVLEAIQEKSCWVAEIDDELAGVVCWLLPDKHPRSKTRAFLLSSARSTFLTCPPHGLDGFKFQPAIDRFHRNDPSIYFTLAATSPRFQRRGVATKLLAAMFAEAEELNVSVFLETSNHKNLGLYEKLGFEIIDRAQPLKKGPEVLAMLRPAPSAG